MAYQFAPFVIQWIQSVPLDRWFPKSMTYGDAEEDHLMLQMSRRGYEKGITIQAVSVRKAYRQQGHTRKLIKQIEESAKSHGLDYIAIESVVSKKMKRLIESEGYELDPNTTADYIKKIK